MKIAILGTGPSAAYVAMACDKMSVECEIYSNKSPTLFFPGIFYPRLNPTKLPLKKTKIYFHAIGNASEYLRKQWGMVDPDWLDKTSFPITSSSEMVYNPYELFVPFWKDRDICMMQLTDIAVIKLAKIFDVVFMTFPTQKSKSKMHPYTIKYPIISYKIDSILTPYCVYDGKEDSYIVRLSGLFGYVHLEYSKDYIPKLELTKGGKITWVQDTLPNTPEWDPCDVPAENVILVGRHAQWSRKVLSHDAYARALKVLEQRM